MAQGIKINRDMLHIYLWRRSDAEDCIVINQSQLAQKLGIGREALNAILREFQREGRIEMVQWLANKQQLYQIAEPEAWMARQAR